MRVIFLDIDGVLNCQSSKSNCNGLIGIDGDKVKRLRKIMEESKGKIVLCSSWKSVWERFDKDIQDVLGNYLDRKLKRENIFIFDKTDDSGSNRGHGITNWISNMDNVESWIVIDDEIFKDYHSCGILSHLVKTSFYADDGGLQDEHVDLAVELLKK